MYLYSYIISEVIKPNAYDILYNSKLHIAMAVKIFLMDIMLLYNGNYVVCSETLNLVVNKVTLSYTYNYFL